MKIPVQLPFRPGRQRALCALALCSVAFLAAPLARSEATPEKAGSAALLDQFRRSIWAEPVYAEFDLRQMPRRGDEHVFHGRLWGARNDLGPVTRFELDVGKGGFTRHILVQSGPDAAAWVSEGAGTGSLDAHALLNPLVPGVEMAPFDLQMPYLYWLDFTASGLQRIRGRPAFTYIFTPAGDFAAANPGIRSVTAYLDTQYDALVQSEVNGTDGHVAKTLSLLELRKVGNRWILKDVDVRNEATRDKTRLSVTALATGISVNPATFDPSQLGAEAVPPAPERITRIAQ